ncbi:hypothetical protein BJ973_009003 [Actinoplanes tereljensis]|uniref:Uncharacterized protein n=1 Tax=Paractinoplanes tereljensis TaxID=571912 RepID=A0A919NG75_9ACTN|nr:hypothetical protein [Actinoplanes tereljensis]GIF18031.1 hypothetical protein Ate02nite_07610 [Actinoplanes tereljensis]
MDGDQSQAIVRWFGDLNEPAKREFFDGRHAAGCPDGLDSETYVDWARDAASTAKMAQDFADGGEDRNRAEFWDAVCRLLMRKAGRPVDGVPDPLTELRYQGYLEAVADDRSGVEQTALRARSEAEFEAWLEVQLLHVPMPSTQKPAIRGFREGDRVILRRPFAGESRHYQQSATGTAVITNTSPAQIRLGRSAGLIDVLMDDGGLIGIDTSDLAKVDRRASVVYAPDGQSVGLQQFGQLRP